MKHLSAPFLGQEIITTHGGSESNPGCREVHLSIDSICQVPSHRELQTQALGVCPWLVTLQVYDHSQHRSTGSLGGKRLQGPPASAWSHTQRSQGLLSPAPGAVHEHLRAPGHPAPPPAPASTPLRTGGCALHRPSSMPELLLSAARPPTWWPPTPVLDHSPRRLPSPLLPFLPSTSRLSGVASAALD